MIRHVLLYPLYTLVIGINIPDLLHKIPNVIIANSSLRWYYNCLNHKLEQLSISAEEGLSCSDTGS